MTNDTWGLLLPPTDFVVTRAGHYAGVAFALAARRGEAVVSDADKLHRFHRSSGVEIIEPPFDRPYGLRDYTVRNAYGYRLTFGHRL